MKIFRLIMKKRLQSRVYKYTLKYLDALSKSDSFYKLYESFTAIAKQVAEILSKNSTDYAKSIKKAQQVAEYLSKRSKDYAKNIKEAQKYKIKSEHYKHLAEIYLSKKLDLEEALQYYNYRKV